MKRRTTVRLDEGLLREAKRLARETGRTLTEVIADALRVAVAQGRVERPGPRRGRGRERELPVSKNTGGLLPGVRLI